MSKLQKEAVRKVITVSINVRTPFTSSNCCRKTEIVNKFKIFKKNIFIALIISLLAVEKPKLSINSRFVDHASPVVRQNRMNLTKDLLVLLQEDYHPKGLALSNVWDAFQRKYKCSVSATQFDLSKMKDAFTLLNDVIVTRDVGGVDYLFLKNQTPAPGLEWGAGAVLQQAKSHTSQLNTRAPVGSVPTGIRPLSVNVMIPGQRMALPNPLTPWQTMHVPMAANSVIRPPQGETNYGLLLD